jgi:hypothetical protein
LVWTQGMFCVARRFWLPCHIFKKSLSEVIMWNSFPPPRSTWTCHFEY